MNDEQTPKSPKRRRKQQTPDAPRDVRVLETRGMVPGARYHPTPPAGVGPETHYVTATTIGAESAVSRCGWADGRRVEVVIEGGPSRAIVLEYRALPGGSR